MLCIPIETAAYKTQTCNKQVPLDLEYQGYEHMSRLLFRDSFESFKMKKCFIDFFIFVVLFVKSL